MNDLAIRTARADELEVLGSALVDEMADGPTSLLAGARESYGGGQLGTSCAAIIGPMSLQGASSAELKQAAINGGMLTLRMSGITKILAGVTTPEEILRVTMAD